MIASPDGERWLVEDLDVGDEEFGFWSLETIISGDRVLVRQGEEVMVFEVDDPLHRSTQVTDVIATKRDRPVCLMHG